MINQYGLLKIANDTINYLTEERDIRYNMPNIGLIKLVSASMFKGVILNNIINYQDIQRIHINATICGLISIQNLNQAILAAADKMLYFMPLGKVYKELTTEPCFICSGMFLSNHNNLAFYTILYKEQIVIFLDKLIRHLPWNTPKDIKYIKGILENWFLYNSKFLRSYGSSSDIVNTILVSGNHSLAEFIALQFRYYRTSLEIKDAYNIFLCLIKTKKRHATLLSGSFDCTTVGNFHMKKIIK